MEAKSIMITATVGVIIAIMLTAAILLPIVGTYTDDNTSYTNTGTPFTTPDGGNHELLITTDHKITFDGKDVPYPDVNHSGQVILMMGSDWILRMAQSNPSAQATYSLAGPNNVFDLLGNSDAGTLTATITDTDVSYTLGTTTKTRTGLEYTIADDGEYVLSMDPHILEDTSIVVGLRNNTNEATADVFEIVSGDINNLQASVARAVINTATPNTGATTSTFEVITHQVSGDLLSLDMITQTMTFWNDATGTIAFDYAIVPDTITYPNPSKVASDVVSLLSIIPILVIASIVVGTVGMIYLRRE